MFKKALVLIALPVALATATVQAAGDTPTAGSTVLGVAVAVDRIETSGFRASRLLGADVRNDGGDAIGTVDELIVDSEAGVSVAVLSVGGFLGMGAHHVAVPTEQFQVDGDYKIVLPGASKAALEKLPQFRYAR